MFMLKPRVQPLVLSAGLLCSFLSGCGSDGDAGTSSSNPDTTDSTGLASKSEGDGPGTPAEEVALEGYVTSAFEVTVDGTRYADLEDFYSQELVRIPERLEKAGLPADTPFSFEAQVGISDLWQNMRVYVSAVEDRGYLGTTRVSSEGSFRIAFPWEASESEYKIRAVKRISLLVTAEGESSRYCYNFSARDQNVLLSEREKPVILDEFETRITSYACSEEQPESGLEIPYRSTPAASLPPVISAPTESSEPDSASGGDESPASTQEANAVLLSPGQSSEEALAAFGVENIAIVSDGWCVVRNVENLCAVNYLTSCPCSVTFDEEGNLSGQTNVRASLLDVSSWW